MPNTVYSHDDRNKKFKHEDKHSAVDDMAAISDDSDVLSPPLDLTLASLSDSVSNDE